METEISTPKNLRKGLLHLDQLIMGFVRNPVFQESNVIEVDSAIRAGRDLVAVIEQSERLKKSAVRLSKAPATPQ